MYAGLAPLEFEPENAVRWSQPGPGLLFERSGIAFSETPVVWPVSEQPGEVSVELWVVPADEPDDRMGHVFAIFDGSRIDPLLVGQWKSGLVVRNRVADGSGSVRYRELGALGDLRRDEPRFIAVTSSAQGTAVYLDGHETGHRSNIPVIDAGEAFGGRLVLGNSASGTAPWQGELQGIAVYRRALTAEAIARHHARVAAGAVSMLAGEPGLVALYPFDEGSGDSAGSRVAGGPRLHLPAAFRRLRTQTLQLPELRGRRPATIGWDALLNVLGFAPLGFFAVAAARRRGWGAGGGVVIGAVALGVGLSLGIELVQVELPARVSSATDLVCNALGTALGAWLGCRGPLAARVLSAANR